MTDFTIAIDLSGLLQAAPIINREIFPRLHQAVGAVARATEAQWKAAVNDAKLWSGEKEAYIDSISWRWTGDFSAEVFSDYKHAVAIDQGRPERDLKEMLNTSTKVRRTTDGRRFLVIPLRHNVPGSGAHAPPMPAAVYQVAQALDPSRIVGQGRRPSGEVTSLGRGGMRPAARQSQFLSNPATQTHYTVARNQYQWGGRLRRSDLAGMSREQQRRYEGMYRFEAGSGGEKRSIYLTFRIMMEGQTGWIVPAKPGLQLVRKVVETIKPKAEETFREAATRDLSFSG